MTENDPAVEEELAGADSAEKDPAEKLKEAVEVDVADAGTLRKKLTVTIPRETIDEQLSGEFSELKREATVPGFRRGHAPLRLIQKRFGSEVGDQVVSRLVSSGYLAAVEKTELKPLGDPLIWTSGEGDEGERLMAIDKALETMELPADGALTFVCEVEIRPEFELPELKGIRVERPKVGVDEDDIQREIDRVRSLRGTFVPVEGEPIEIDDLVIADLNLTIDGDVVKEEKNVTLAARPQRLEGIAVEDLGEKLKGKKNGDTVKVEATVAAEHDNADWHGKKAEFELTVADIKRLELPPLDASFLESLGYDSEQELREHMRSRLEARLESVIKRGMRGQIGKYLLDHTTLDVPSGLSQRQTDRLVTRRMVDLFQQGVPEQEIHKQMDALRARASEDTVTELKLFFIMEKIAEQMEIDVHDDELNGAIAMIAQQQGKRFDRVRDELSKGEGLAALYLQLRDDRILDRLLVDAQITDVEGPKKGSSEKQTTAGESSATQGEEKSSSAAPKGNQA